MHPLKKPACGVSTRYILIVKIWRLGSQRNVHSYAAHEVIDLKCARENGGIVVSGLDCPEREPVRKVSLIYIKCISSVCV